MHFKDRKHAGEQLAEALKQYQGKGTVVYALPRGGVVLGVIIAKRLGADFDLLVPRKIGHPYSQEYDIAAVAENGDIVRNEEELGHVDPEWFKKAGADERAEAKRRRKLYLGNRKPTAAASKICIIIDDGLATGLTMKVAIKMLAHRKPKTIIVAVPVAPEDTVREIAKLVDDVVALYIPAGYFGAIGSYYQDFDEVSDEEVVSLIQTVRPAA